MLLLGNIFTFLIATWNSVSISNFEISILVKWGKDANGLSWKDLIIAFLKKRRNAFKTLILLPQLIQVTSQCGGTGQWPLWLAGCCSQRGQRTHRMLDPGWPMVVSAWWMPTLQLHLTTSDPREGCSSPAFMLTELKEWTFHCLRKNMTIHVDQLPSQNKNTLRTDEVQWFAHYPVWARRKARLRPHHAQTCSPLQHCFISSICTCF